LTRWSQWYLDVTGVDGIRLDAIKHVSSWFFSPWIDELVTYRKSKPLFVVGEYWSGDIAGLQWYIGATQGKMSVFDVPLHYNFNQASRMGSNYDMRKLLDGTLMQTRPTQAVTFVEDHDSQPLQALESVVESWFKPLAYAVILLRQEGYPCVFHADYFGAEYQGKGHDGNTYKIILPSHRALI